MAHITMTDNHAERKNVLGQELSPCCTTTRTGFLRNGFCEVNAYDRGNHSVCAIVTDDFLQFSLKQGNDLITPRPEWQFPGLKAGDRWCLCASRWQEALIADVAPPVILEACDEACLKTVKLADLKEHSFKND